MKVAQEMTDNMRLLNSSLIKKQSYYSREDILIEIDVLKTKLIDNLEENKILTKEVFTELFDILFDLGKDIENINVLNDLYLSKFEDINRKVKEIVG